MSNSYFNYGEDLNCPPQETTTTSAACPPSIRDAAREASERAAKATPGPWEPVLPEPEEVCMYSVTAEGLSGHTLADCYCCLDAQDEANMYFIAAARTDVPTLAAAVNALADELERVRKDAAREVEAAKGGKDG